VKEVRERVASVDIYIVLQHYYHISPLSIRTVKTRKVVGKGGENLMWNHGSTHTGYTRPHLTVDKHKVLGQLKKSILHGQRKEKGKMDLDLIDTPCRQFMLTAIHLANAPFYNL